MVIREVQRVEAISLEEDIITEGRKIVVEEEASSASDVDGCVRKGPPTSMVPYRSASWPEGGF